jgi:ABC-type antimicrobial peptide transport system permease subunit
MVSTVVIYQQLNYIHNRDIGFDKDKLLYIRMPQVVDRDKNADALKTELRRSWSIAGLTITWDIPTNLGASSPLTWRGMEKGRLVIATRLGVDENYITTMGMKMAAGRFYSPVYRDNDSEYVVNETAVRVMGVEPAAAVGRMITINGQEGAIIGVVKDFNFKPVYQPIEPLVLKHRASGAYFVIRPAVGGLQQTLATVGNIFHRIYGNAPFSYGFVDQDLDHLYKAESRMGSLFTIFSALSIAISCLGLFGLAAFATRRRKKEIGVRKILGAGEAGIVVLLAKEFLRLVAISLLIAFPLAWYVMHRWLDGFVYKTGISGWIFVAAGGLALLIAFITVSYQTIRAATANPVNSLRSE